MPRTVAILALACLAALLVVVATLALRRWWMARRLNAQMAAAADGERLAERWLTARGYRIIERQLRRRATMHINGRVAEFDVRADLLVERDGEELLVEVKTGAAADPRVPETRRQLREYAALFPVDGLLVFDASQQRLYEVLFPDEP